MRKRIFLLILICLCEMAVADNGCTWPKYFDVSKKGWPIKDEERSWETETKVETDLNPKINWFPKSRKLISIWDNRTLDIITFANKKRSEAVRYSCNREFGNGIFLLKEDATGKLRCMQLVKQSKFVIRWALGGYTTVNQCNPGFAPISNSPLIYFPVRETSLQSNLNKYHDFLNESKPCPPSDGYMISEIHQSDGTRVDSQCQNMGFTSRLEIDCAAGEGIQIREAKNCEQFSMVGGVGSKLICLAHWDEGIYSFRVLVPAGATKINSFHCLRLNAQAPTSQNAILFLDNVCSTAIPDQKTMSYFKLSLRHREITSMCDDYTDTCTGACSTESKRKECFQSCASCPVNDTAGLESEEDIRGEWLVQRKGRVSEISISDYEFKFAGLGTFKAYSKSIDDSCIAAPKALEKDSFEYVLAVDTDKNGCVPRVSQFRMKTVSDSVALIHLTATAPLRNNDQIFTPSKWCYNNFVDIESYASLFNPYWTYSAKKASMDSSGFQIVVRNDRQNADCCRLGVEPVVYAAHMSVKVEFRAGGKLYSCMGETHTSGDKEWTLNYKSCNHQNAGGDLVFQCLANFEVNDNYQAIALKANQPANPDQELVLDDQFYCLMIPKEGNTNLPIIIQQAGECDAAFAEWVMKNEMKAVVKLSYLEKLEGPIPSVDSCDQTGAGAGAGTGHMFQISYLCLFIILIHYFHDS